MSHQALYRRFRSKTFDEVIGQEHVTKTLKNQILSNNIAHAYLFCGIRGTGKTSTAKILARAVNCTNNVDGNPCNECEACKSILDEINMDVIEMDAASNNGVEDIRELRDKVKFLPAKSKYKVYIIDEVHMLSKGAFNALLKTLEEPPTHLIFILATTEPQKIPATILSRCQRFDLRRITIDDLVKNMKNICDEIGVLVDEKALNLIACNSDGAMRDALSILDRCITFNSEKIKYTDVNELLGIVNFDSIIEVCDCIINKDIKGTMTLINNTLNQGKDLQLYIEEIVTYFRNLLIYKTTNVSDNLIRITEDNIDSLKKHIDKLTVNQIVSIVQKLSDTLLECKRSMNPRIVFETKVISLMEINNKLDTTELEKRIEQLEEALRNGLVVRESVKTTSRVPETNNIAVNKSKATEKTEQRPVKTSKPIESNLAVLNDEDAENKIRENWNDFLKLIRSENAGLSAIIRESKLSSVKNKVICFEFDSKYTFHYTAANQEKNRVKLKEILTNFLNAEYNVNFIIKSDKNDNSNVKSMDDVYEEMKSAFGDDKVELK